MIVFGLNGAAPPPSPAYVVGQVVVSAKDDGTHIGWVWSGEEWLEAAGYGEPVSRETHAALYAVIRDHFGKPDDETLFILPDLRERTLVSDPFKET